MEARRTFFLEEEGSRRRCRCGDIVEIRRALLLSAVFCVFSSHYAINCMNFSAVSNELYRQILDTYYDCRGGAVYGRGKKKGRLQKFSWAFLLTSLAVEELTRLTQTVIFWFQICSTRTRDRISHPSDVLFQAIYRLENITVHQLTFFPCSHRKGRLNFWVLISVGAEMQRHFWKSHLQFILKLKLRF